MNEEKRMIRKKRRKIIISVISIMLLVFIAFHMFQFYKLKSEAKRILESPIRIEVDTDIDIVGMLDSYGVPYSPSVNNNFVTYLSEELVKGKSLGSELDLFNLYINKTWHLNGIYSNKVTIGENVEMQNFSLDFVKHKYEGKVKDSLSYECAEELKDVSIYDYTKELEHPVILYSCSANDLFYYYGFSLEHLNMHKCMELISKFNKSKDELGKHIDSNIETLLNCNPRSQIFIMGLYVPSDNFFIQRAGSSVIDQINDEIEKTCEKYDNVYYVDVSCLSFCVLEGDFHPNEDGQYIIAYKLAESISDNYKDLSGTQLTIKVNDSSQESSDTSLKDEYEEYVDKIYDSIVNCGLPIDDSTEAAVAIEYALNECNIQDIDYEVLNAVSEKIVIKFDSENQEKIREGFRINVIERKILHGIKESDYSSHPESVKNDKLSLIEYY